MCVFEYSSAELEDESEVGVHLCFELFDLLVRELIFAVVKDFLGEHFEDGEVVFADVHIFD